MLAPLVLATLLQAQNWTQWGQNSGHTGSVNVPGQPQQTILGQFTYDPLADIMRRDTGGDLLAHYMAPLVDNGDVFVMNRGKTEWISCRTGVFPCGSQRWNEMEWGLTKLDAAGLQPQWTFTSTWKPAPNNGSGWEPVFHPILLDAFVYLPAASGTVIKVDRYTGEFVDQFNPFDGEINASRYIVSPIVADAKGFLYYTVLDLDPQSPWSQDVRGAWLARIDTSNGETRRVAFADMIPDAPRGTTCLTNFAGSPFPWPPSPTAKPPASACGSQRPGLNSAPAIGPDGTIVIASRAHLNSYYSYLVALNADLTTRWTASLRDRLNDGCDVLLPPSGTGWGCRAGTTPGVDPQTNEKPAGRVQDQSTSSPVIAPDGSILYGAFTAYNYSRGHLFHFSAAGEYLNAYDFGWDITPAVYEHDGTYSVILKDNLYPVGSYCGSALFCGQADPIYSISSLDASLKPEWNFRNTNDQVCERQPDDTLRCVSKGSPGFEWCVNMVAVDKNGTVYANSEDGNVYAIDRGGNEIGRVFLKVAIGAAYTPLAIGEDGRIYTQNDGVLFVTGAKPAS